VNYGRLLVGSLLLALGVVLILDVTEVLDAGEVLATLWPIALIAAGGLLWLSNRRHWVVPAIVAGLGVVMLLNRLEVWDVGAEIIFPALIIVVGVSVLTGGRRRPGADDAGDAHRVNAFAAFSGTEVASHSKRFEGGQIGAVFGGAEVDLRDAQLAPGASMDVFTAFGGTEVRVPEGWRVTTRGFPLFGGFDNVTVGERLAEDAPTLDITATVLFGGLEVKH